MKRWLIALGILVVLCGGLAVAGRMLLRSIVNGAQKDKIAATLGEKMGVPVSIAMIEIDLSQWFRLRPAVALRDIAIGNPPGFHEKNLIAAKTISARVLLLPLFHKRVEVQSIAVESPRISVETNAKGVTNIEALLKKLSSNSGSPSSSSNTSISIADFSVTSGELNSKAENVSLHEINLQVRGFSLDRASEISMSAKYATGSVSGFKLDGHAGPFKPDSLPVDARLSLTIAPNEIPPTLRREQFGVMLATPGAKARAGLEATIKGDAYQSFSGPAKITLSNIMIGGHNDRLLPLSGDAPAQFKATNLMSTPQFDLNIPKAKLQLGKGHWDGSADMRMHGKVIAGSTQGAIRNIDIDEFLSSFTDSSGRVYGLLAIPSSTLQFSGHNAAETLNSLKGTAKVTVTQGRLGSMDLLSTLEHAFGSMEETAGASGNTNFSTLSANVNIAERKMHVSDLLLDGPALRVTGSGVIGFDETINFSLVAHVSGGTLGKVLYTGPLHLPNMNADVPLTVTGTVQAPRVRPQVGKLAKQTVNQTVRGVVDQFFKKKPQP